MATGREMQAIYMAMQKICIEVSQLLRSVNDQLGEQGFKTRKGSTSVMYDRSNSWDNPEKWMPYFQQVIWNRENDETRAVGINILFDYFERGNLYPVISCGHISSRAGSVNPNNDDFFDAGWFGELRQEGTKIYKSESDACLIHNYFLPLDAITDDEKILTLIVQPLVHLYNSDCAKDTLLLLHAELQSVMKTVEEICGTNP